jgi:hypothetical protein
MSLAVQNVVILMLENRSFDEYFGTFPGANGFYNDPQSICQNAWIASLGGWVGPTFFRIGSARSRRSRATRRRATTAGGRCMNSLLTAQ